MVEWQKIKAEYISGNTSYRKLADKHGVSFNTLKDRAVAEQWYKLRQHNHNKTTKKIIDAVSEKSAKIDDKYFRLVDKLLDKAEETIDDVDKWHPTLLKEMATTMKYLKECKGIKSEADIREQEARIDKLRREAELDESKKKMPDFVITGLPEEFKR